MSLTHINFDWIFYYCMVGMVTLWNCGFTAITRKGKIMHFILKFFERTRPAKEYFSDEANHHYDQDLIKAISAVIGDPYTKKTLMQTKVQEFLDHHKIFCVATTYDIYMQASFSTKSCQNSYYRLVEKPVFPDLVKDPVVSCITCMASFHSLVLYSAVTFFLHLYWNPFEWVVIAIPCAFTGEFLWKLKTKLEK